MARDTLFHNADYSAPASVYLSHNGIMVWSEENMMPPRVISLDNGPGEYVVEIRPTQKAKPARVVIQYEEQAAEQE